MKISVKTACVSRLSVSCDYGKTYLKLRKTKVRTTKENTCVRVSFSIKLKACSFIKKTQAQLFSTVNFAKVFITTFLLSTWEQPLLNLQHLLRYLLSYKFWWVDLIILNFSKGNRKLIIFTLQLNTQREVFLKLLLKHLPRRRYSQKLPR